MTRNIKLTIEYDGTGYHGWQSQKGSGRATIQDTIEDAVRKLSGEEVRIYSSGRTDAGVHALGHVANFHSSLSMPPEAWAPALNQHLPFDIRVINSSEAAPDFHARYSATGKLYRYRILNRRPPTALLRNHAWHINLPLSLGSMQDAVACLIGTHDFSAFRSSGCTAKTTVRTLKKAEVRQSGDIIDILLEADAFLQYMARNITGTLVEAGLGRFTSTDVAHILSSCDRRVAGKTAPAHGLCLIAVYYPS